MFPENGSLLACVSGGADSMCLLAVLAEISGMRGYALRAAHYNHMLRGEESDRDEAFVRGYCAANDIPFYSQRGDVSSYAKARRLGTEEAAREMRYRFFHEVAADIGADRIVTAHTADDNAETVLMNLIRGAGTNGLTGIPPRRGAVVRPMLKVLRRDILRYLNEHDITFIDDSTNNLEIYTRNKLRRSIIPFIKEINPKFTESVAATAELLRADEVFLSKTADSITGRDAEDPAFLSALPFAVSSRVIRRLSGLNLSHKHVRAVLDLCRKSGPPASLSLPGNTVVYVEYGRIAFADKTGDGFRQVWPVAGESARIGSLGLIISCESVICSEQFSAAPGIINKSFTSFLFKCDALCGRISVRPRREGDSIRFFGKNGSRTLKKLFIDLHIPARERANIPVIADDAGVLAVYGFGMGDRAVPEPGDRAVQLVFEKGESNV